MTQIGELAWRARFDGRELSRGLLSTRQEMKLASRFQEEMRTSSDRLRDGMQNIENLVTKYPQLASRKLEFERRLKIEVLEHARALGQLTREQERNLVALQKQQAAYAKKTGFGAVPVGSEKEGGPTFFGMTPRLLAGGAAIAQIRSSLFQAADMERAERMLGVMTGSAAQAKVLMAEMRALSQQGIKMSGLQDAAKTMIGFGVETQRVMPLLQAMANIAGGDTERIQGLSLAFAQASASGRLMAEEMNQMIERGFNPLSEISRTTGLSMVTLKEMMKNGEISVKMLENSFITATMAGGRFHGALAEGNAGLSGSLNRLSSDVEMLSTKFGTALAPAAESFAKALSAGMPILDSYVEAANNVANAFKSAADFAAKIIPPELEYLRNLASPVVSGIAAAPSMVTTFTAKARGLDESVGMEAADRVRKAFGRGFFSEENNARIDAFMQNRIDKALAEDQRRIDAAKAMVPQQLPPQQAQQSAQQLTPPRPPMPVPNPEAQAQLQAQKQQLAATKEQLSAQKRTNETLRELIETVDERLPGHGN